MDRLKAYFHAQLPLINSSLEAGIQGLHPLVLPVAEHVLEAGGKRLRPLLCRLVSTALGHDPESGIPLGCALEYLHSATLLHDDILDGAELRRGRQAAHKVFGFRKTILTGDALLALANRLIADYDIPRLMSCASAAIVETASGEILEIASAGQPSLTRDEYLEIIRGKTAFLIQASCQCGAILAKAGHDVEEGAKAYGLNLGIAFQLVDDALDYSVPSESTGKPSGGDLREGKITLPLILLLETLDPVRRKEILSKVTSGSLAPEEAKWLIREIKRLDLPEQTRAEASKYLELAREGLALFPASIHKELLQDILHYVQTRRN